MHSFPILSSFLIAISIAGTAAQATPPSKEAPIPTSSEYDACVNEAGAVDHLMAACTFQEEQKWDQRLNVAYRTIMADPMIFAPQKLQLRRGERAWIEKRYTSCTPPASEAGGTIAELNQSGCLLEQTARRALYLERYRLESHQ